jgi:DNA repair protein RecN (Recombination protein N)
VREGADQGEVLAEFALAPDHPAHAILDEAGLATGEELILRRTNSRDGRKQAWVNDRRCSGEILRRISDTLVELHGQQDDKGLLNTRAHRALLDEFAAADPSLKTTRKTWRALSEARKALDARKARLEELSRDREYLAHAVAELDKLDPQPGEDQVLDTQRRLMQAAERIREDIQRAAQALSLEGAEGQMRDATRWLDGVEAQAEGRLQDPLAAVSRAMENLALAQQGVEACLNALDFNPHELEAVEERLFAIRGLARKHSVTADVLGDLAQELRKRLEEIEGGQGDITALEDAVKQAEADYQTAAKALTTLRQKASQRLDKAMAAELAPLKMERAIFTTEVTPAAEGPDGADAVQFVVATNPGAPSGPLNKIASGGELSRFLLALKVCLKGNVAGLTMIFDEIDRGVGGATADAVGRRLAELAKGGQVLVVTHSPQVAALGGHHWRVVKSVAAGKTTSDVVPVTGAQRVDEVARMLAGDTVTDEARAAASVLLKTA